MNLFLSTKMVPVRTIAGPMASKEIKITLSKNLRVPHKDEHSAQIDGS